MKRQATDVEVFMVSSEKISFICAWRSFSKIRGISAHIVMLNAISYLFYSMKQTAVKI